MGIVLLSSLWIFYHREQHCQVCNSRHKQVHLGFQVDWGSSKPNKVMAAKVAWLLHTCCTHIAVRMVFLWQNSPLPISIPRWSHVLPIIFLFFPLWQHNEISQAFLTAVEYCFGLKKLLSVIQCPLRLSGALLNTSRQLCTMEAHCNAIVPLLGRP